MFAIIRDDAHQIDTACLSFCHPLVCILSECIPNNCVVRRLDRGKTKAPLGSERGLVARYEAILAIFAAGSCCALVAVLVRRLRMLLGSVCVLFALGMVALAVMLCCGAVRFRGVLMMLGCFVVFVSCHGDAPWSMSPK
jgi:hypothetical protein